MKSSDPRAVSVLSMHDTGPAPEAQIVRDLVRRGAIVAPVVVGACAIAWGADGAWSSAYGLAIVLVNFALNAWMVSASARISYALMMGATLFGYLFRLALVAVAVFTVRDLAWVELVPMCITLVVAHVGLLFWELRYVSLSLAFPGLKPAANAPDSDPSPAD